jgi:hypothetical protein
MLISRSHTPSTFVWYWYFGEWNSLTIAVAMSNGVAWPLAFTRAMMSL